MGFFWGGGGITYVIFSSHVNNRITIMLCFYQKNFSAILLKDTHMDSANSNLTQNLE